MISANLLVHTVTLKKAAGTDRDRNETYKEYTIEKVRVNAEMGQTRGSEGETPSDAATLFVDAANSRTADTESDLSPRIAIDKGDRVEWNGREFTVQSVRPCYADGPTARHWEIALK